MKIVILILIAFGCGTTVFVSPSVIMLGAISTGASIVITGYCLLHAHTAAAAFLYAALFLGVFQATFMVALYFWTNSRNGANFQKIKRHPLA